MHYINLRFTYLVLLMTTVLLL